MPNLLVIGSYTDALLDQLGAHFNICDAPSADVTHVFTNGHAGIPSDVLGKLPNLQMISCYGVGYDNIDANLCASKGIKVSHTPNVLNDEVATTAILLMLACYRELLRDDAWVRSGNWATKGETPLTRSADNQIIGILGMGRIGQAIAEKLKAFNATILYHTRSAKDVPYEYCSDLVSMAERCNTLIVITPGGANTRHLVNKKVLGALGPTGTLINVARGSVVDQTALVQALSSGKLGWAGLDVFENEPAVPQDLCDLPNVVLLPHVGSATVETRKAMRDLAINNLVQHLKNGTVISPVAECADL